MRRVSLSVVFTIAAVLASVHSYEAGGSASARLTEPPAAALQTVTINPNIRYQTMRGWGGLGER